jgi:hypothetical protein
MNPHIYPDKFIRDFRERPSKTSYVTAAWFSLVASSTSGMKAANKAHQVIPIATNTVSHEVFVQPSSDEITFASLRPYQKALCVTFISALVGISLYVVIFTITYTSQVVARVEKSILAFTVWA